MQVNRIGGGHFYKYVFLTFAVKRVKKAICPKILGPRMTIPEVWSFKCGGDAHRQHAKCQPPVCVAPRSSRANSASTEMPVHYITVALQEGRRPEMNAKSQGRSWHRKYTAGLIPFFVALDETRFSACTYVFGVMCWQDCSLAIPH
jgi:hypothetical protein